jgi:hypothetical protein
MFGRFLWLPANLKVHGLIFRDSVSCLLAMRWNPHLKVHERQGASGLLDEFPNTVLENWCSYM